MGTGVALAECRKCHEPIRFVELPTGNRIPVNPRPDDHGTIAARQTGRTLTGRVLRRAERTIPSGFDLYRVHFATCEARTPPPPTPEPDATLPGL